MRNRDERDWDERDVGYGGRWDREPREHGEQHREYPPARGDWRATGRERSEEHREDYFADRGDPSGEGFGDMRRYDQEWRYGRADRMDPIEEVGDLRERGSRVVPGRTGRGHEREEYRGRAQLGYQGSLGGTDREDRERFARERGARERYMGERHDRYEEGRSARDRWDREREQAFEADARRRDAMRREAMRDEELRREAARRSPRRELMHREDPRGGEMGDPVAASRRGFGSGAGSAGAMRGSGLSPAGSDGLASGPMETGRLEDRAVSGGYGSAGQGGSGSFGGSYHDTITYGLTSSASDAAGDRVLNRGFGRSEVAQADHTRSGAFAGGTFAGRGPRNYRRSDARIEEEVCEALMRDPHVDASDIEVTVRDGEVTLSGEVEDRRAKRHAEDVVEQCTGVRDVHNHLKARRGLLGGLFGSGERAD